MWHSVYKFSSPLLSSAENIKKIISVIPTSGCAAVFSDFYGVYDKLIEISNIANNHKKYETQLNAVIEAHKNICNELNVNFSAIESLFAQLKEIYKNLYNENNLTLKLLDKIVSYGELLSTTIISSYANLPLLNSIHIIKTDDNYGHANINMQLSKENISKNYVNKTVIIGGNIGSDDKGNPTTLGKHGSDYTAALIADLCEAKIIHIWHEFDCIYTCDRQYVKKAAPLKNIEYSYLSSLIESGGDLRIISKRAFDILKNKEIKIVFKNPLLETNNQTTISSEKIDSKYFLLIDAEDKVLFNFESSSEVVKSNLFDIMYVDNNKYTIIANERNFNDAKITLGSYKPEINESIAIITIISKNVDETIFNEVKKHLQDNGVNVITSHLKTGDIESIIVVNQDSKIKTLQLSYDVLSKYLL